MKITKLISLLLPLIASCSNSKVAANDENKNNNSNNMVSSLEDSSLDDAILVNNKYKVPSHYEYLYYESRTNNDITGGFSEAPNTYCYLKNINSIIISNLEEENFVNVSILRFVNPYIGWKGIYRYKYEFFFQNGNLHLTIFNELDSFGFINESETDENFNPLDNKNYVVYITTNTLDYRIELIQSEEEKVEYNTMYIKNN